MRAGGLLPDILQVFAGLESNGSTGRDAYFLAGPRVASDAALARLHLEHAEPAQFDSIAALHREPHGVEHRVDRHLGFHLRDVGDLRDLVDDIDLDHAAVTSAASTVTTIKRIT